MSILCESEAVVIIFSQTGKLLDFSSSRLPCVLKVNGSYYAVYAVRFTISCRYEQHGKVKFQLSLKVNLNHIIAR
ncbi:hypothetical protein DVH24_022648 [Malus domestica]|uniref:MADS-box domain-containing protein n=1 Tax=Malus domestica TaxID=3750 RepID=A0A498KPY4_MALDO|nr:hypothetical protein DVH24_022648 [Malus domestica]